MISMLFNREKGEAYGLGHAAHAEGGRGHLFGGEARHEGAIPPGCEKPVHLFYDFNLNDPRLGIRFPDSKLSRLPFYYALGNCGGSFKYRVVSDSRIKL